MSSTIHKQPLGERSANLPSPMKSPSKIPLPPSPEKQSLNTTNQPYTDREGVMSEAFEQSSKLQNPEPVRNISQAHDAGQTYVSPSDQILSPTTKKLSDVKGRRFG